VLNSYNQGLHSVLLYRLARWFYLNHLGAVAYVVSYFNGIITGAQISARAKIGMGFTILHPVATVIGADTIIGKNCLLVGSNYIGQNNYNGQRPVIGDDFYAGSGAKILGSIVIGNRVKVGANAVVLHSCPDDATLVGIPAKIVVRR
jgi:serine O-acetyltransferase